MKNFAFVLAMPSCRWGKAITLGCITSKVGPLVWDAVWPLVSHAYVLYLQDYVCALFARLCVCFICKIMCVLYLIVFN